VQEKQTAVAFALHLVASVNLHGAQDCETIAEELISVGIGEVAVAPEGGVVVLQDAARLLRV
jgi:hypothetical protein